MCVCTSIQPVCRLIDHTQLLQKNISYVVMLCDMYQLHHTQPVAMNSSCSPSPLFLHLFTCISSIDSPPTTLLLPHHTITFIPPSFPPPSHSSPSTIPHSQPTISHSSSPTIPLSTITHPSPRPSHTPITFLPTNLYTSSLSSFSLVTPHYSTFLHYFPVSHPLLHPNTSFQTPPHTPVTLLPLISPSLNSTCCFPIFCVTAAL